MRSPKINVLLLVLNVGLLLAVAYLLHAQHVFSRRPSTVSSAREAAAAASSEAPGGDSRASVAAPSGGAGVAFRFDWSQLESEDYNTYIQRLRSISCPEQTIRDLIIADLDKLMAPRLQAIYGRRKDLHYWQPEEEELANNHDHRDWWRQEREIEQEKRDVIRELVKTDLIRERLKQKGYADFYERRLGFLPEDKRSEVRTLLEKYDDQEHKIRGREYEDSDPPSAEDQAQLKKIQAERQASVAQVLSPAELDQFELWMSPSANTARRAVYGMNATEDEFLAVYRARQAFDQAWSRVDPALMDDATRARWEQSKVSMDEEIKSQLGEERHRDYKRGEDEEFHDLNATVSRYKLPREIAVEVYEYKRVVADIRAKVQNDRSLPADRRTPMLQAISTEAERSVRTLLGEKAFNYYLKRGQGQWLRP